MDIFFSFSCWNQLNKLTYQESNNLFHIIRETIALNIHSQKISDNLTNNQPLIINLKTNENHYLIGAIFPLAKVIKFLGFSSNNDIDLEKSSYHINIIDTDLDLNNILSKINSNFQLNSHLISSITIEDDDFYLDKLTLSNLNNSCILLSSQQKELLNNNTLPILLSGNQGTGKTTLTLYHALKQLVENQNNPEYKIVYITNNQSEQKQIINIVKTLNKSIPKNFLVKDYHSFTKNFATENELKTKNQFFAQRQITEYKFKEQFCQENNLFNFNTDLLWQEIKQLIKGSEKSLKNSQGLISLSDYLAFQNQSIFSPESNFNQIYQLANKYQEWLENNNYWDQIDLVQHILKKLPDNYSGKYDAIYVDDIHRLSEIEIQLIFKLLKIENKQEYTPQLFLAGEDNSHLITSNFNWGRVKKIALEQYLKYPQWVKIRPKLEPKYLNYSFSTTDKINNFLNCVVNFLLENEVKEEIIVQSQSAWIHSNYKPLVIFSTESEILAQGDRFSGSNCIIVKTPQEKEKLANLFPKDSERILLVNEINNLQFSQILIWSFFDIEEDINQQNKNSQRQFYQDLFVAIKSAKKRIYFYNQSNNNFWNQEEISNLVELGYPTELGEFFSEDKEEDINIITNNYLHTGSYKAYKICSQIYFQANDILGAARIEALLEEVKGNWGQAGDIWNKLQIFDEAIRCWNEVDGKLWEAKWATTKRENWSQRGLYFEQKRDFDLANFCYDKAKDFAGKLRCLEANNDWEIAGDKCREKELLSQAQKYYELADKYYQSKNQFQSAVKMWTRLGRLDKVALIWENLEQWEKAGNCWQKQGNIQRAANCWQKAQKWSEAQKCWLELGKWNDLGFSYESQGEWVSAAQIWQKQGDLERAGFCYQNANEWALAEDLWRKLEYWGYVAIALQQQKKWQEAAQTWEKTSPYELQALCYERLENWEKAKEAWLKANKWSQSIICAEKEEKWEEAAESWENLGKWQSAGKAWEKAGEIEKAAFCYEQGNFWGEAEECWRQLESESAIAITLEKQEKWALAGEIWQELEEWKLAGKAWEKAGDIEKAALIYETGNHWREAEECWRLLGDEAKTEAAATKQGTWVAAAHDWLKSNQIEQAALCYEKCQDWERAEKYWQQTKNWEKLAQVSEQQNKWQQAAQAHLNDDNPEKAALCYEKLQDWQKAEECWRKAWKWEQLARVCEQQQKWKQAADAWMKADNLEKAVNYYEKIQDWENAEECWRQLSNWEKLAIVCENQAKWEEAAQLWTFLNNWQKAALACLAMDDVETAIKYYEKGNYTEEAEKLRKNN